MTMKTLKTTAATAALALGVMSAAAQAESIRLATVDGEGDLLNNVYWTYTEVFNTVLSNATGGEYDLQVFPNSQLGDLESLLEQTARGSLQVVAGISAGHLQAYTNAAAVLELPYVFPDTATAREVMNGPFGDMLTDQIAEDSGVRIISYLPSAFRNFSTADKQIKTPEDMVGLKMRTQQIPIHVTMVEALGANPTPIAWSELYSALQTGVVDGQENAPYTMLMANLQEVQGYYTLDHHLINMPIIAMNDDYYQSLPEEVKAAVDQAADEAAFAMLGVIAAKESQDMKAIRDAGVEIYQPTPEEFQMFVDKVQGPVEEVLAGITGQELIDELKAAVAEVQAD
ncbi:ABC transporter substrate-binding protein [Salipiger pallidus]|uniref:ABC transporter substrate-binding protein n=1 Tax=Salipiger pallidus TaxID=1775170 RepID=A0A8J3EEM9_9RHOB|nr:TRAP transporter substrate-binding protein [Salipiger pallidus]GGG64965.1 ABC transporter substrate-binding protein [Salipiger pallidus]